MKFTTSRFTNSLLSLAERRGEDTGDPCLRSRSCIYTGWVIHGLHGTVTPVRSINILRAVIPQHPQPSPPFMPRIRTYTVGSACIPSHVRRCIIFPRHAVVSAHAKAAEPGTGNVGHVYTTSLPPFPCVSSGSSHGMHKSEIVARDDDDDGNNNNALSTPCIVLSRDN